MGAYSKKGNTTCYIERKDKMNYDEDGAQELLTGIIIAMVAVFISGIIAIIVTHC
jgi:hypothetical protein